MRGPKVNGVQSGEKESHDITLVLELQISANCQA